MLLGPDAATLQPVQENASYKPLLWQAPGYPLVSKSARGGLRTKINKCIVKPKGPSYGTLKLSEHISQRHSGSDTMK